MRLISARIQHYKSLTDVTLNNLGPLTVLVGANASGKSNVVDALRFLRDMVAGGLDHAFSMRNGITMVRQQSKTRPFKIQLTIHLLDDKEREHSYEVVIKSHKIGNFIVELERISWHENRLVGFNDDDEEDDNQLIEKSIRKYALRKEDGTLILDGKQMRQKLPKDVTSLGITVNWDTLGNSISSFLNQTRFSSIYPNTLKRPAPPDTDRVLKESGENWASILKAIKRTREGRSTFTQILEIMQKILPKLEDVVITTVGGYLVPQFRFNGRNGIHSFDPAQLSDGTLRILGILLALYQYPRSKLLVIEEPEQTVHPAVLAMLAESFREASELSQIIITSHSPHLIDNFKPEEIRVVTLEENGTRVSPIRKEQVESVKQRLISLEEFMMAEGLQAEVS